MSNETSQPEMSLEAFTYRERVDLMPELGLGIDAAGGWILQRHSVSANALQVVLEVQVMALPEVYSALIAAGLELTRGSHRALAERCNCSLHLRPSFGVASILVMHVVVHFLSEEPRTVDLAKLFPLGAAAA